MSKRIISLSLAVIMLALTCLTSVYASYNASALTKTEVSSFEVTSGVAYKNYAVTSGKVGSSESAASNAHMLTFGTDDYLPMVYSAWAGGSGKLEYQYNKATTEGYEVAAVINGAFFSMSSSAYGTLVGIDISDGKIVNAHSGYADSVVAFGSDGSMNVVDTALSYKLYINGELVPDALGYINKRGGSGTWYNCFYYWDQACGPIDGAKTDSVAAHPGYEILCDKLDGAELTVGGTLRATVAEVRADSYASSLGRNQFVLFCLTDSPYAEYVKDLEVGDVIEINVDETVEASKEIMRNATSVITNVGWLVKNGVDQTELVTEIGTHNVEYSAPWTAFGIKENGDYVYFVSDKNDSTSLTMKDVAKLMIQEGCVNVIRMDGGGSSAMYLSNTGSGSAGYAYNQGRAIADCIMIVKRSSMQSETKINALQSAISKSEDILKQSNVNALKSAVTNASSVLADKGKVNSDYLHALSTILRVTNALSDIAELNKTYESIVKSDYSRYALDLIDAAYKNMTAVANNADSTVEEYFSAVLAMRDALALKGEVKENLAYGKTYKYSLTPNSDYPDATGKELTDGEYGSTASLFHPSWVGLNGADFTVTLDLGEKKKNISSFAINVAAMQSWGIRMPSKIDISISDDNVNFTSVGTIAQSANYKNEGAFENYVLENVNVSGRYIKFAIARAENGFVFLSEIEVNTVHQTTSQYQRGDINRDEVVDSLDYILLKRACYGILQLDEEQQELADINKDGEMNAMDYVLLKRACLDNYTIEQ